MTEIVITLGISLIALLLSALALLLTGQVNQADRKITEYLRDLQTNETQMRLLERQYETASATVQAAISLAAALIKSVAPLTRLQADDELVSMLEDVQKPDGVDEKNQQQNAK